MENTVTLTKAVAKVACSRFCQELWRELHRTRRMLGKNFRQEAGNATFATAFSQPQSRPWRDEERAAFGHGGGAAGPIVFAAGGIGISASSRFHLAASSGLPQASYNCTRACTASRSSLREVAGMVRSLSFSPR